jgi:hypothetical protein
VQCPQHGMSGVIRRGREMELALSCHVIPLPCYGAARRGQADAGALMDCSLQKHEPNQPLVFISYQVSGPL